MFGTRSTAGDPEHAYQGNRVLIESDADRKPRKADIAYEELRRKIVTLELEPGSVIDERQLIERLAIGRTPVREAIQRLIHEGMIIHNPRRGSWVSPLSLTELHAMIEARRMLELECARQAATRITPDQVSELRNEVDRSGPAIKADDISTLISIDQRFHVGIAWATGNRYLVKMTEQLHNELTRYWYVSAMRVGHLHIVRRHHHAILDALETGDPTFAAHTMDEHITLFRERLSTLISGSPLESNELSATFGGR
ncbi:MAG: GntR family transcriptional regulator [Sphaerobacteraceae bacterium]|nr:MAG: GntR family transcriptional regulator [Sphaerobacteraceae bacterium]